MYAISTFQLFITENSCCSRSVNAMYGVFAFFFFITVTVLPGSTVVTCDLFLSIRLLFHKNCGQFISLDSNRTTARRVDSYNHGVVLSEKPLPDNHLFQVR